MASLEATRPGSQASAPPSTSRTTESASLPRALSPPPARPVSPLAGRQPRHQALSLPAVPDHEPDAPSSALSGSLYDRRQQTQQHSRSAIGKLRLPPNRLSTGSGVALAGVAGRTQQPLTAPHASPAMAIGRGQAVNQDDDEVEEVLEELDDEPEAVLANIQSEQSAACDVGASCLAVQSAALAALRSCIYAMLNLSMPEGNTDSSNPVTTVQILNQVLQSTYSYSTAPGSASTLPTLTRQLNQVAAQQPLLANSEDLALSQALLRLLSALSAARGAPLPPPAAPAATSLRPRSVDERPSSSGGHQQQESDFPISAQSSPLSPPMSTIHSTSGSDSGIVSRAGHESGHAGIARRGSMTTVASSPAASDELRDPFAETRFQDEFSVLLRRIQTLSSFVPDAGSSSKSSTGSAFDNEGSSRPPSVSSFTGRTKSSGGAESKAEPWSQLRASMAQVREMSTARKRSSVPGSRTHSFLESPMSPTLHSQHLSKGQSRSRSASRRGSFSSINSPSNILDGHPTSQSDALLLSNPTGGVRSSSSSGRQSTQSLCSSTFSMNGNLADFSAAPTATLAGMKPTNEYRTSISSTTDVSSSTAPPKYSMDSLVDPYLGGVSSPPDGKRAELPAYTGTPVFRTASEEKLALSRPSLESMSSGHGSLTQELESRRKPKRTLASDLDAIENGIERLFALSPQLTDQRAVHRPRRRSAASEPGTSQAGLGSATGSSLGHARGKQRMIDIDSAEDELARQATLQEVADKLSRPGMVRLEDQRAAPPRLSIASTSGKPLTREQSPISSSVKADLAYEKAAGSTHSRSLSQRLADVVSFKRPSAQRRNPPSPLLISAEHEVHTTTSSPKTARAPERSRISHEPVYIGGLRAEPQTARERRADPEDLFDTIDAMARATGRSLDDQRVVMKPRFNAAAKKLGLDQSQPRNLEEDDDDLLEQLMKSSSRSRLADQEAEFRPRPSTQVSKSIGHSPANSIWSNPPLSAPALEADIQGHGRSATGLTPSFHKDGAAQKLSHRATSSVPVAVLQPLSSGAATEPGPSHLKPASLAAASALRGWEQMQDPSSSPRGEGAQHEESNERALNVKEDDKIEPSDGDEALAAEGDFQERLSEATSASGSLSPAVKTHATSAALVLSFRVDFVAETQPGLRSMQVLLRVPDPSSPATTTIMSNATYSVPANDTTTLQILHTSTDNSRHNHTFRLPSPATAGHGIVTAEVDHGSIRLQLATRTGLNGHERVTDTLPLSHTFFSDIKSEGIFCDACGGVLATWSPAVTYRALPSDHWEELIESWMCHSDQRLHESIIKGRDAIQRSGADAERDEVWVGDFHLAVSLHKALGVRISDAMPSVDSERPSEERAAMCRHCGLRIGHELRDIAHSDSSGSAVRFMKVAIRPLTPRLSNLPSNLSVVVSNQMSSLADMYGTRHFDLFDSDSDGADPICQLWLFTPRCRFALDPAGSWLDKLWRRHVDGVGAEKEVAPAPGAVVFTAAKVLYRPRMDSATTAAESASLQLRRTERLEYPSPICAHLMDTLRRSTEVYPPSRRAFGPWMVGWLEI
ncbi:hypothetical protein OC835_001834 [Tilletia horrida]|nr:hypothetical protein OC835_001834 [Tilletia horrida]